VRRISCIQPKHSDKRSECSKSELAVGDRHRRGRRHATVAGGFLGGERELHRHPHQAGKSQPAREESRELVGLGLERDRPARPKRVSTVLVERLRNSAKS
jgi:hypothetical protein